MRTTESSPPPSRPPAAARDLHVVRPGRVSYAKALGWQRDAATAVRDGTGPETLFLLEHPPVVTLGRRAKTDANLRLARERYAEQGVTVVETDRGGDVTFHGPGQVVGYPILDLRKRGLGARSHLHQMEEILIRVLAAYGIEAHRDASHMGVWTSAGKIAAMGIRVSAGVSLHGFALNVNTDLDFFGLIVPCGIPDRAVTSMCSILGRTIRLDEVMDAIEREYAAVTEGAAKERP